MTTPCPSCGTASSGRFCRSCGASLAARCTGCGSERPEGSRFCPQCGFGEGQAPARSDRWAWFIAGGAVALGVGGLVLGLTPVRLVRADGPTGPAVPVATASAPDISALTPRERFDRLYNRVMRAAESDDQATVSAFAPMAIQAYAMLDQVDVDARYHVALIQLHSGGLAEARAQGDSIAAAEPGHLFAFLVQGAIARYEKDQLALDSIYRAFLTRYPAEQQRGRPEYTEHARALEDFAAAARSATTRSGS